MSNIRRLLLNAPQRITQLHVQTGVSTRYFVNNVVSDKSGLGTTTTARSLLWKIMGMKGDYQRQTSGVLGSVRELVFLLDAKSELMRIYHSVNNAINTDDVETLHLLMKPELAEEILDTRAKWRSELASLLLQRQSDIRPRRYVRKLSVVDMQAYIMARRQDGKEEMVELEDVMHGDFHDIVHAIAHLNAEYLDLGDVGIQMRDDNNQWINCDEGEEFDTLEELSHNDTFIVDIGRNMLFSIEIPLIENGQRNRYNQMEATINDISVLMTEQL